MMGSSRRYLVGTLTASVLVFVGTLLPWVRKLPVATAAESPEGMGARYTLEGLPTAASGLTLPLDLFTIVPALLALVVVAVAVTTRGSRYWLSDGALVALGSAILFVAGEGYVEYYTTQRYAVEPGLYLVLLGGVLLIAIGGREVLGGLAGRRDDPVTT